ncbi:MAG: transporter permease [Microbacteriaceae bacterium]|jgi:ribose transport system permease protein|nr:transporter permease [Microbacteriaceae bacterium]
MSSSLTEASGLKSLLQSVLKPASARGSRSSGLMRLLGNYGTIFALVIMIVVFTIVEPSTFPTLGNIRNVLTDMSLAAIVAAGVTLPLVAGDFDLSVGYVASFSGILVVGLLSNGQWPVPLAIVTAIGAGLLIGIINGLVVSKLGVNAFIATLGTGTLVIGLNYAYSGGMPIALTHSQSFTEISLGQFWGIPNLILIMATALVLLWVLLNRTVQGQHIKAVGKSPETARRAGIAVDGTRVIAFAISGTCAAITGVLLASNLGSGQVTAGDGYMLSAFAAAYLGSAALHQGEFHIVGTLIGVLTVAVGNNGLAILGAPIFTQYMFSGGLLVIAVALGSVSRRYAA